jgi:hypothetical protein
MESKIIELSRYTSKDAPSNAEWTNTLSTPQTIEQGDYIMIKQAFIDTRLIDNNSILIEKQIEWTLYYMTWINNNGYCSYDFLQNQLKPDGMPYVLVNANLNSSNAPKYYGKPVLDQIIITIPPGIYERSYLAEFISRQLQQVNIIQNNKVVNQTSYTDSTPMIYPLYDDENNFIGFSKTSRVPNLVCSLQKPINPCAYGNSGDQPVFNGSMMYQDGDSNYIQGFLMPLCESSYYNKYASPYYGMFYMSGAEWNNDSLVDAQVLYNNTLFYLYKGTMIGASEIAFVYNDNNGDNRFSFQYAHSPILNKGNEVVGLYCESVNDKASDNKVAYLTAHSGILFVDTFTNLSDDPDNDPFFQLLGLKYNDIVSPNIKEYYIKSNVLINNNNYLPFPYSSFLDYTTRNKITLQSLTISTGISTVAGSQGNPFDMYSYSQTYENVYGVGDPQDIYDFQTSTITETIKCSLPPISSTTNGGHYLIELITSYNNEYYNDEKNYQIKAVIGTFYLSGDSFVMSMGPDSYIYQHHGEPAQLSSCKIRILNPITKEPAGELGANSTIYLQITKERDIVPKDKTK